MNPETLISDRSCNTGQRTYIYIGTKIITNRVNNQTSLNSEELNHKMFQ